LFYCLAPGQMRAYDWRRVASYPRAWHQTGRTSQLPGKPTESRSRSTATRFGA
jgi:hypothetical protein